MTLWWPNSRAAVLTLGSGGGGFVQGHKLLCTSPGGSGAALEEQGHVALGSRLDPCLSEIPWPRQ